VTGLKWWSGVPPIHTLRAFKPIRWELGFSSLHFIPTDAVLVESPLAGRMETKVQSLPG